jgi:ElaB/YqjD/DUF883 family membrane-anchored ribosome-binding protein
MTTVPPESQMKHDIEKISAGLAALLEEAEDLLQSAAAGANSKLDAAEHEARAALKRTCGHLRNARSELLDRARKIDDVAHAHPWRMLAAGAILGLCAGMLVRRR